MKVYYSGDTVEFDGTAVALGNFDGLHIAHMKIINSAVDYAKKNKLKSGVLLFDHHSTEITKLRNVSLIMPNKYKIELLEKSGVDFVYLVKFDKSFMENSPEEFVCFLRKKLAMACVSVGYDYRFGFCATGNTQKLYKLANKYGFAVLVTDKVTLNGNLVGSTYIRQLINSGEIEKATEYLGRYFFVDGVVIHGRQNGRKMGFPTANISYNPKIVLPPDGVYAGITTVDERKYKSVINIGNNPTFNAEEKTIETHILDFDKDIYEKDIKVEFVKKLRGEIKFKSADELKIQIRKDAETAKKLL